LCDVVAWNTPGVDMLQGRADLAALWDLRIAPDNRGQGMAKEVRANALTSALERGCKQFKAGCGC
jgi:hypothetical protein